MTSALVGLEPQQLWKHFDVLAATPRASTKEAAARNYVLEQAKKLGLKWTQDAAGNVVVRKPARPGRENAPLLCCRGISTWSARRMKGQHTISTRIRSRSGATAIG